MNDGSQNISLGEAATRFLASLLPEERGASQQEVYRFVRWYGLERHLARLMAPEVANYAERLSLSDTNYTKKLELIRSFLVYAKKKGWSEVNLAIQLKAKKGKALSQSSSRRGLARETVTLTQQGYAELKAELDTLKGKRLDAIDEMRRAAADKDFRENAPLDAAKEQCGQLEGRIEGLERTLKSAIIIGGEQKDIMIKVGIGDRVVLCDLASGDELRYTVVSSQEVDPTQGKISSVSPIGKALIGRGQGEVADVIAPAGKLRYQIKQVER